MKSLAHPDWPYAGTAHEWRGFVKYDGKGNDLHLEGHTFTGVQRVSKDVAEQLKAIYQKQNFGPELK